MDNRDFTTIVENRLGRVRAMMIRKGDVYAFQDRLSNFFHAAEFLRCSPERVLWGYVTKHIIALNDFISIIDKAGDISSHELEEKTSDIIAYMLLLEAILVENSMMPMPKENQ